MIVQVLYGETGGIGEMRRIRMTVAYDGTNYCGWQIQKNGVTVEEVLKASLKQMAF